MELRVEGRVTEVSLEQPRKHLSPMELRVEGRVTEARDLQLKKQLFPREVAPSWISIEVIEEYSSNQ